MSLVDPAVAGKVLPKSNKPSGTLKMKKSIAKNVKPEDGGKPSHGWREMLFHQLIKA